MLKRLFVMLVLVLGLSLQGCVAAGAGFKSFVDSTDGYKFLYPNGWVQVQVSSGADVVFHDIIQQTENVSVVINPVAAGKTLKDLGSPGEVGYRLANSAIAPPGSGRKAELVNAEEREVNGKTHYILEYATDVNGNKRHNFASVAVSRGKLYTFNASTPEDRWEKMESLLKGAAESFTLD
ncbi:MAG TPA: photosystem II reaction center PsbP family protein [Leptolyngbyaceae cyanobacterium M33_DOE_097]|uniref:Photosystem II oxygen evolving complex protein PsbP n=1 Tax=Oscillatoriales cyanobacterium SpSt-418 TaxID=2282169 RepID=A0A7C3PIH4_9CYAN|nr:photosystem II reaction center PsbP family protein [Leptolyngbyaceae cyanobacterium M33_DOE_097]